MGGEKGHLPENKWLFGKTHEPLGKRWEIRWFCGDVCFSGLWRLLSGHEGQTSLGAPGKGVLTVEFF